MSLESSVILTALASQNDAVTKKVLASCDRKAQEYLCHAFDSITAKDTHGSSIADSSSADTALSKLNALSAEDIFKLFSTVDELSLYGDNKQRSAYAYTQFAKLANSISVFVLHSNELSDDILALCSANLAIGLLNEKWHADQYDASTLSAVGVHEQNVTGAHDQNMAGADAPSTAGAYPHSCTGADAPSTTSSHYHSSAGAVSQSAADEDAHSSDDQDKRTYSIERILRLLTALLSWNNKLSNDFLQDHFLTASPYRGIAEDKAFELRGRIGAILKDFFSSIEFDTDKYLAWLPEDRVVELLHYVSDKDKADLILKLHNCDLWIDVLAEQGLERLRSGFCGHLSLCADNAALKLPDADDGITVRFSPYQLADSVSASSANYASSGAEPTAGCAGVTTTAAGAWTAAPARVHGIATPERGAGIAMPAGGAVVTSTSSADDGLSLDESIAAGKDVHISAGEISKLACFHKIKLVIGRNLALFDRVLPESLLYIDINELETLLCHNKAHLLSKIKALSAIASDRSKGTNYTIDADTAEVIVFAFLVNHIAGGYKSFSVSSDLIRSIMGSAHGASLKYLYECVSESELSTLFAQRINEFFEDDTCLYGYDDYSVSTDSSFANALRRNFMDKLEVHDASSLNQKLKNSIIIAPKNLWPALNEVLDVEFTLGDDAYQPLSAQLLTSQPLPNEALNDLLLKLSKQGACRPAFLSDVIKIGLSAPRSLFSATAGKRAQYAFRSRNINDYCDLILSAYITRHDLADDKSTICCDLSDIAELKIMSAQLILKGAIFLVGYSHELLNHSFNLKVLCEQLFLNAVAAVSSTTALKLSSLEDKYSLISGELGKALLELVTVDSNSDALDAHQNTSSISHSSHDARKEHPAHYNSSLHSAALNENGHSNALAAATNRQHAAADNYVPYSEDGNGYDQYADAADRNGAYGVDDGVHDRDADAADHYVSYSEDGNVYAPYADAADHYVPYSEDGNVYNAHAAAVDAHGSFADDRAKHGRDSASVAKNAPHGAFSSNNSIEISENELAYEQINYARSMEQEQERAYAKQRNADDYLESVQEDSEDLFSSDLIDLDSTLIVKKLDSHPNNKCIAVYKAELNPIVKELMFIFDRQIVEISVPDASVYSASAQLADDESSSFIMDRESLSEVEIEDAIVAKANEIRDGEADAGHNLAIELSLVKTSNEEDVFLNLDSAVSMAAAFKREQHRIRDRYSERMLPYYQASQLKILQRIIEAHRDALATRKASDEAYLYQSEDEASNGTDPSLSSREQNNADLGFRSSAAIDAIYIIAYDKDISTTAALCRALKLNVLIISLEALSDGRVSIESVAKALGLHKLDDIPVVLDNVCLEEISSLTPLLDVLSNYAADDDGDRSSASEDGSIASDDEDAHGSYAPNEDGVRGSKASEDEDERSSYASDKAHERGNYATDDVHSYAENDDSRTSAMAISGATADAEQNSDAQEKVRFGHDAVVYPHLSAIGHHILKLKQAKNYGVYTTKSYDTSAYYYGDNTLAAMIESCMAVIKSSTGTLTGRMQVFCIDPNLTLLSYSEDEFLNDHDRYRPSHFVDLPLFDNDADRKSMLKLVMSITGNDTAFETRQALSKLELLSRAFNTSEDPISHVGPYETDGPSETDFSHSTPAELNSMELDGAGHDAVGAYGSMSSVGIGSDLDAAGVYDTNGSTGIGSGQLGRAEVLGATAGSAFGSNETHWGAASNASRSSIGDDFVGRTTYGARDGKDIYRNTQRGLDKTLSSYGSEYDKHETIQNLELGQDHPNGHKAIKLAMDVISKLFIGGHEWRPYQANALPHILQKRNDYLISIPTGGGKSVLFQGPALYRSSFSHKLTIVISPLRALILDQILELRNKGFISVDYLSGDRSNQANQECYAQVLSGKINVLYVTPERFRSRRFFITICERMQRDGGAEYIVFDEAHCISQWGKEFRPDYLNAARLSKLLRQIFPMSIIMCSATMTNQVTAELSEYLVNPLRLGENTKNYNPIRDHIQIRMQYVEDSFDARIDAIVKVIKSEKIDFSKSRMIIFCPTRKLCEEVSSILNYEATKAALKERSSQQSSKNPQQRKRRNSLADLAGHVYFFHARQSNATRKSVYERFKAAYQQDDALNINSDTLDLIARAQDMPSQTSFSKTDRHSAKDIAKRLINSYKDSDVDESHSKRPVYVLCATKAFGMGMDIPNIHYVIHYCPPQVFEDYLQEVGRAGRDMAGYREAFPSGEKLPAVCLYNENDFEKANEQLIKQLISWNEVMHADSTIRTYIQTFSSLKSATRTPRMCPYDVLNRNPERILQPVVDPNPSEDGVRERLLFSILENIGRIRTQFTGLCPLPIRVNLENMRNYLSKAQFTFDIASGTHGLSYDEIVSSVINSLPELDTDKNSSNSAKTSQDAASTAAVINASAVDAHIASTIDDSNASVAHSEESVALSNAKGSNSPNKSSSYGTLANASYAAKPTLTNSLPHNAKDFKNTLDIGHALYQIVQRDIEAAAITLDKLNAAIAAVSASSKTTDADISGATHALAADSAQTAPSETNAQAAPDAGNSTAAPSASNATTAPDASNSSSPATASSANADANNHDASNFEASAAAQQLKIDTFNSLRSKLNGATTMHKIETLGSNVDRESLADLMSAQLIDLNLFAKENKMNATQTINTMIELMRHGAIDISAPFSMKFRDPRITEVNYFFKDTYTGSSTDDNYLLSHLPTIAISIKLLRAVLSKAHERYLRALRTVKEVNSVQQRQAKLNRYAEHFYKDSEQAAIEDNLSDQALAQELTKHYTDAHLASPMDVLSGNGEAFAHSPAQMVSAMTQLHRNALEKHAQQDQAQGQAGKARHRKGFNIEENLLITRTKCYVTITEIISPLIDSFPRVPIKLKESTNETTQADENDESASEEGETLILMPWADKGNKKSIITVESYLKFLTRCAFKLLAQTAAYLPDISVRYDKLLYHEAYQASALLLEVRSDAFHLFLDVIEADLVSLIELVQLSQVNQAISTRTVQSDLVANYLDDIFDPSKSGSDFSSESYSSKASAAVKASTLSAVSSENAPALNASRVTASNTANAASDNNTVDAVAASAKDAATRSASAVSADNAVLASNAASAGNGASAKAICKSLVANSAAALSNISIKHEQFVYSKLFDNTEWHENWCSVIIKLGLLHNDADELLSNYELRNSRKRINKYLPQLRDHLYGYNYFRFLLDSLNTLNFVYSSPLMNFGVEAFVHKDALGEMDTGEAATSEFYERRQNFEKLEQYKRLRINIMRIFCTAVQEHKRASFIMNIFNSSCLKDLEVSMQEHSDENSVLMQQISAKALEIEEQKLSDNPEQYAIYNAPLDVNINVLAGPGSGKTHVLTLRVVRLIYREHVDPESILVLAYNRAVVIELKNRLSSLFSALGMPRIGRRIKVFTFHGLAKLCLRDGIEGFDTSNWEQALADRLTNEPQLFSSMFPRLEYIMIDEFQDITSTRLEVLKIINTQYNNLHLFTIGDINQSIYGFDRIKQPEDSSTEKVQISPSDYASRLSPIPYYKVLNKYFNPKTMYLSRNYRSYQSILQAASRFLTDTKFLPKTAPSIEHFATEDSYAHVLDLCGKDKDRRWFKDLPHFIDFAREQNAIADKLKQDANLLIVKAQEEAAAARKSIIFDLSEDVREQHEEQEKIKQAVNDAYSETLKNLQTLSNFINDEFDDAIPELAPIDTTLGSSCANKESDDAISEFPPIDSTLGSSCANNAFDEQLLAKRIRDPVRGVNIDQLVNKLNNQKFLEGKALNLMHQAERTEIKTIALMFRTNNDVYRGLNQIRDSLPNDVHMRIQGATSFSLYRERELFEIAFYILSNGERLCTPNADNSSPSDDASASSSTGERLCTPNVDKSSPSDDASTSSSTSDEPAQHDDGNAHSTAEEFKDYILGVMREYPMWDHVLLDIAYCTVLSFLDQIQDADRQANYRDLYDYYVDLLGNDEGGQIWKLYERYRNERIIKEDRINVILTTMHKVKGLEFDLVMVIPSFSPLPISKHNNVYNPDSYKHSKYGNRSDAADASKSIQLADDELADIDEERRLSYVAYTRARKYLYAYQSHREHCIEAAQRYICSDKQLSAYAEKTPTLENYYISFTAKTDNYAINNYIRRSVVRNDPVTLELVSIQSSNSYRSRTVCNIVHQVDANHKPKIIGRLSSRNPIYSAMQQNNVQRLSGLFISNIVAWSYEDTCLSDERRRKEYLSKSIYDREPVCFANQWCNQAKNDGYVYVIVLTGYGKPI